MQLSAQLGTTYKTAWYMLKRIRAAMAGLMLVRKIFQGWYVTAITVAADYAIFCEGGLSKFSDGSLFDIFQISILICMKLGKFLILPNLVDTGTALFVC